MSQTVPDASSSLGGSSLAGLTPNRRLAQFGVALIALLLVACFGVLIAARADHAPQQATPSASVAR